MPNLKPTAEPLLFFLTAQRLFITCFHCQRLNDSSETGLLILLLANVGLVEIWEDRNSFYLFMELCSGGELYHAISERYAS